MRVVHKWPLHCPRCWVHQNSKSEFVKHQMAGCKTAPKPADDRLDDLQWCELWESCKWDSSISEEERWKILYGKLFPGEPVPSPCKWLLNDDCVRHLTDADYADPFTTIKSLQHRIKIHLPQLLRNRMERELEEELQPLCERLLPKLQNLIDECFEQICQMSDDRESNGRTAHPADNSVDLSYQTTQRSPKHTENLPGLRTCDQRDKGKGRASQIDCREDDTLRQSIEDYFDEPPPDMLSSTEYLGTISIDGISNWELELQEEFFRLSENVNLQAYPYLE
jgi:hypothetical protein